LALELTTESQKLITYPDLFIEGIKIEFVKDINCFGIIIDENLHWNHHIDAVSEKIQKILGIMSKVRHFWLIVL
jgi:hypothetical protein